MVASMIAHEGVVGVGVLPSDIDLPKMNLNNDLALSSQYQIVASTPNPARHASSSSQNSIVNQRPMLKNYCSLMEEEEEDNEFHS